MPRLLLLLLVQLPLLTLTAQPRFSEPHGLYDLSQLTVAIHPATPGAAIHYTTDGSQPTAASPLYTQPLRLTSTTVLRAIETPSQQQAASAATATYIFVSSVLSQTNTPDGYPSQWGKYAQRSGTAIADYEMDPELTADPALRNHIIQGLYTLPILSIVTDRNHLFSREANDSTGGIYIFTGPPVGDNTGKGWTRPASIELFGGPQRHSLAIPCGLRLHGGHGRLAEKNPKHSFRLLFKSDYGPSKLHYPLYGDSADYDQLVLRCHFGNSWQHQDAARRKRAQYTRDVWARKMQAQMGHVAVNALHVHLFLNGLYWGVYNIAERVDEQFCKSRFGGKKSHYDVVKIEEEGGRHLEASEGTLDKWQRMVETVAQAAQPEAYNRLQGLDANGVADPALEPLLHIPSFIDYMLINQYAGNTDWDHHNWYAIAHRGADSGGFRFLCWDSEQIFESRSDNVIAKNTGDNNPTGLFHRLLQNPDFARRYLRRAQQLLGDGGMLAQQSVVHLWDSLHHTVRQALYCESARWGDYRRDVHPYTSKGELYTVDNHYAAQRDYLIGKYFPVRSSRVLADIQAYVEQQTGITGIRRHPSANPSAAPSALYNLHGQRIAKPAKGVYIYRGKKVVGE